MPKPFTFEPGSKVNLAKIPTHVGQDDFEKKDAVNRIELNAEKMADLARRLYAENKRSVLLVLQGMDTAGKDGTIREVVKGLNPTSCQVVSFKKPSEEELDHDFLWRVHQAVPRKGNIGIFNRSHYEDVLIVRVHNLAPKSVWQTRYDSINDFEKLLAVNGTVILKCFLHISKDEQRQRLQARIDDPNAHWKFNPLDLEERKFWHEYQEAYQVALEKCNTAYAPWYIIPADQKWYRNLIVSELLCSALNELDPQFPIAEADYEHLKVE